MGEADVSHSCSFRNGSNVPMLQKYSSLILTPAHLYLLENIYVILLQIVFNTSTSV